MAPQKSTKNTEMTHQKSTEMAPHSHGYVKRRILDLLRDMGPMTRFEIQEQLPFSKGSISQAICAMHKETQHFGKRVHICAWVRSVQGTRDYLRAVYAYGDGKDAKKPPRISPQQARQRYKQRAHALYTSSSVFRFGASMTNAVKTFSGALR